MLKKHNVRELCALSHTTHEHNEAGMITTELAFAIPTVIVIGITCAWFISIAILGVQLNSLSATYARILARGDRITPALQAQLPNTTDVNISKSGDYVKVKLTTFKRFPIPRLNQTVSIHGEAIARMESMP